MKFPNWFRISWWVLLLVLLTLFLWRRYDALVNGNGTLTDIIVFLVWIALALAPVFPDIDLFGLRLKQKLQEVKAELGEIRADIRNVVDIRNQFSPTFAVFPTIPSEELPGLLKEVRERAQSRVGVTEVDAKNSESAARDVPSNVSFLFSTRYALEGELRRIYRLRIGAIADDRTIPISRITRALVQSEIIDRDAAVAAEELYRIASRVIHGGYVQDMQMKFAYDVAGWLLAELKNIK